MVIDDELKARIERLTLDFVRIYTRTGTRRERDAEAFYRDWFSSVGYFRGGRLSGFYEIPGDHLGRSIPWCLLKGDGDATVVLLHHYDVVDTDDYMALCGIATEPEELMRAFRDGRAALDEESESDLASGRWIFGRGAADMKGGAAIQMALVERYAKMAETAPLRGNILLIGLPDEENISAGGRAAPRLLKKLKDEYGLRYELALNAEPTERIPGIGKPAIFTGSIGKIMPLIYVRGKLSHAGTVYDGLNPIKIISKIVEKLDVIPDLIDSAEGVVSPAPTFLYQKDVKRIYDVSLPLAASAYMNVMFLQRSVGEIMDVIREKCVFAFKEAIGDVQRSFDAFAEVVGREPAKLPWEAVVKLYSELYAEAVRDSGQQFERALEETVRDIKAKTASGETDMVSASHAVIELTLRYVRDTSPAVIVALTPPYYPVVGNPMLGAAADRVNRVCDEVIAFAKDKYDEEYTKSYIVGMSDLSYFMRSGAEDGDAYVRDNMLPLGSVYELPFDEIREISMPVLNIGPLGKDFHEYTERVSKEDLLDRTPDLTAFTIEKILGGFAAGVLPPLTGVIK
ncbi:MAG: M20/M25/M40 family metallo-hydrolase [Synergistaceae bacterium]|jgi:arginine utilization protein RocB|nr:M20/M25/M40 family metallo-hydrolase [Synergistaceae bacterium]